MSNARRSLAMGIVALVATAAISMSAEARLTRSWSYKDLYDAADLVVIVNPTSVRARKEKATLPGITQTAANGTTSAVEGQRVETELEVVVVLKGKALNVKGKASKSILLHHYKEIAGAGPSINGPMFVSFDPKAKVQYLMFLIRGKDGQYVAVSGQTDPWFSVEELRDRAP